MTQLTYSVEPAGIFTGHTHRPRGYRLTFGMGTYDNVFGSVDVRSPGQLLTKPLAIACCLPWHNLEICHGAVSRCCLQFSVVW